MFKHLQDTNNYPGKYVFYKIIVKERFTGKKVLLMQIRNWFRFLQYNPIVLEFHLIHKM